MFGMILRLFSVSLTVLFSVDCLLFTRPPFVGLMTIEQGKSWALLKGVGTANGGIFRSQLEIWNIVRFQIGFKFPSKTTINTKLAGMQSGVLPWHIILLRGDPAGLSEGEWDRVIPSLQCHKPINPCQTSKSVDPAGIWTRDLPLSRRML